MSSVWVNPRALSWSQHEIKQVANILSLSRRSLQHKVNRHGHFVYLKRRISPQVKERLQALSFPGLHFIKEPKRYYPMGEVLAPVLGFTGIDDQGLEGLEVTYNQWLSGSDGAEMVVQDPAGHVLAVKKTVHKSLPGHRRRCFPHPVPSPKFSHPA